RSLKSSGPLSSVPRTRLAMKSYPNAAASRYGFPTDASRYFYRDDVSSRRLRQAILTDEQVLAEARAVAAAEQEKMEPRCIPQYPSFPYPSLLFYARCAVPPMGPRWGSPISHLSRLSPG